MSEMKLVRCKMSFVQFKRFNDTGYTTQSSAFNDVLNKTDPFVFPIISNLVGSTGYRIFLLKDSI